MIDIMVVEDNYDVMLSIKGILETDKEINIVATAVNGVEAVELADKLSPDLVLMDIKLPDLDGLEAARQIKEACKAKKTDIKVLLLSTFYDDEFIERSQKYAVDGYLLKGIEAGKIAAAIKNTCGGFVTLDRVIYEKQKNIVHAYEMDGGASQYGRRKTDMAGPEAADKQENPPGGGDMPGSGLQSEIAGLTDVETSILKLVTDGKTNADIARELFLSRGTVRNYISRMLVKLECKNGRELAAFGTKAGL